MTKKSPQDSIIVRYSLAFMLGKAQTEEDGWFWKRIHIPNLTTGNTGENEKYFGVYSPAVSDFDLPDGGNLYVIKAKRADARRVDRETFETELNVWYEKIRACNPNVPIKWAQDVTV